MTTNMQRIGIFAGAWFLVYLVSLLTPWLGLLSIVIALGILVPLTVWMVRVVLPDCMEFFAEEMFSSTEKGEVDRYLPGFAAVGRGDYPEARRIFRTICREEPLNERVWKRWYEMEKNECQDPYAAVDVLWGAYGQKGWGPEQRAFYLQSLIQHYDSDLNDQARVVELLREGVREFPETQEGRLMALRLEHMGK